MKVVERGGVESGLKDTLPERLTLARQQQLGHAVFLELVLADEVTRRESRSATLRAAKAGLDPTMRLDTFDDQPDLTYDRGLWSDLTTLRFAEAGTGVLVLGPVGVGKTHLATALGHIAIRRRLTVAFHRADKLFTRLRAARLNAQAGKSGVRFATGALLPQLDAVSGYDYLTGGATNTFTGKYPDDRSSLYYGLELRVPIFLPRDHAEVRRARAVRDQRLSQTDMAVRTVAEEVASAWTRWQSAKSTIIAAETAVAATQEAAEGIKKEAVGGNRTLTDVLNAQNELLTARVTLEPSSPTLRVVNRVVTGSPSDKFSISREREYPGWSIIVSGTIPSGADEARPAGTVAVVDPAEHAAWVLRGLLQSAGVTVEGRVVGSIAEAGLLILVGVTHTDTEADAAKLARKSVKQGRKFVAEVLS